MRHIASNKIISITADSSDANFPVSRVLDEHPKRQWKAGPGVYVSTLTATVIGGCSDIMIAGTNAASAEISVTDPNSVAWRNRVTNFWDDSATWDDAESWEDYREETLFAFRSGFAWRAIPSPIAVTSIQRSASRSLWLQLSDRIDIPCIVAITLAGPGSEAVCAGVVMAGPADTYGGSNPSYGLEHRRIDFGISAENSNGSFYYKKRDNVREFSVNGIALRDDAIRMLDTFDTLGSIPSAWRLADLAGNDFVVFGRFADSPQIRHNYPRHSEFSFDIIEVL